MHGPLGLVDIDALLQRARDGAQKLVPEIAARAAADGVRNAMGGGLLARFLGR